MSLLERSLPALPVTLSLDFGVNIRVMAFAFGVAALTGVIFGLAPARHALAADLAPMLHGAHSTVAGSVLLAAPSPVDGVSAAEA